MKKIATLLLLWQSLSSAFLIDSKRVMVSIGESKDHTHISIYRLGVRENFKQKWFKSSIGYLSGYYELSANYWVKGRSSNFGIALSPVFTYNFTFLPTTLQPYIEGGIGGSLWTDTMIATRNVSSHFLFEDRIGAGVRYKGYDLNFCYMHYSNAGLVKPNSGIDIFMLSLSFKY